MSIKKSALPFNFKYSREVKTYEVDFQQIVHNAIYFYYFEEARIEYLKHLGFSIKGEISIADAQFVVVHNEADYHEPARLGDTVDIFARISSLGRSSFTYDMRIVKDDGTDIASGLTTVVTIDGKTGRPVPMPIELKQAIKRFEGTRVNIVDD